MASLLAPTGTTCSYVVEDNDSRKIVVTITQDPLSVTLGSPAIITITFCLIAALRLLQPTAVAVVIALVPIVLLVRNDFKNYLKLGPGGTPSTFTGYIKINWLKLWALKDPFKPLPVPADIEPAEGILKREPLPYRCGPRPNVVGIAPQRQTNQFGSREYYLALRRIMETHAREHDTLFGIGTSCFEKHGMGLFARFPFNNTCQGEIVHVHNSDHAMHMNLHPADLEEVLAKGWGQRHPLTAQGWLKMPVPATFTMIYAPRDAEELRVVCRIIRAAAYWVMAQDIELKMDC